MSNSVFFAAFLAAASIASAETAFEVASVKPVPPGQWRESKTFEDRLDFPYTTLKSCVAFAYSLKEYQVFGPSWIGELRYDIQAKGPAGTKRAELPRMMQKLLAERFHLVARVEQREFNVYALILGKDGPKLKDAAPLADPSAGAIYGMSMTATGVGKVEAKHADMTSLVNTLPRFVGRPVVNLTNLAGRYDFELEFSPDDTKGMAIDLPRDPKPAEFGMSIYTSIQRVGLKLESRKMPLDSVTVDSAEKVPTEN